MKEIVMRLYLKGDIRPIAPRVALSDNVLPSLLSLEAWDTIATPERIVAVERKSGHEVHFTIEDVA